MNQRKTNHPDTHHRKLRRAAPSFVQRIWQRAEALREPRAPTALVTAQLQAAFDALFALAPNLQEPLVGTKERSRLLGGLFPQAGGLVGRVVDALQRNPARYPELPGCADSLSERQLLVERLQLFVALCETLAPRARAMANLLQAQTLHESLGVIDAVQKTAAAIPPRSPGSALRDARVEDMAMAARLLWRYQDDLTRRWRHSRAQRADAPDAALQQKRPPRPADDESAAYEVLAQLAAGLAQR